MGRGLRSLRTREEWESATERLAGYLLCARPSTDALTLASTSAFQGRYYRPHLPDKETEAWKLWLA